MSLADRLAAKPPSKPCVVGKFVDTLEGDDRAVLEAALLDPAIPHARLFAAVKDEYPDVYVPSEFTWGRHRRGGCTCEAS